MCGIVAFHGPRSAEALDLLQACLLQAAMRGTHATGLAWLEDGGLHMEKAPVSAHEFVEHFNLARLAEGEKRLSVVAHTRYSTSDLAWNQPLDDVELALVMNGVISQDVPASWPRTDDDLEPYRTGNDAEVAMRYARNLYRGYMPGSFAVVELWVDGRMLAYRNAYRPLYVASVYRGVLVTSTLDMMRRCGFEGHGKPVQPGWVFDLATTLTTGEYFPTHAETQPESRDPRALRCPTE